MSWKTVLNNWKNNKPFTYPKKLKTPFIWRTSVIRDDGNCDYIEEFLKVPILDVHQNFNEFEEYIEKSNDTYVTSFYNLSKDTILVVPIPKKNKNFSNLKNFIDQASKIQQKKFWNQVALIIEREIKTHTYIWVSTHGLKVPYLHVRISTSPKYYNGGILAIP